MPERFRLSIEGTGGRVLAEGPRWLITFLIFFAPFCYGLRDGVGESFFASVAFLAFFLFAWKSFLTGKWPRVPAWLLFCMTWLALQGFWMTLNADSHYRFHDDLVTVRFLELAPFPDLPGSRTRFKSPDHFYPQVGVFCLMIIVVNSPRRVREQYLRLIAVCAVIFAAVGIPLKILWPEGLERLWAFKPDRSPGTAFLTYHYHGNAATFLAVGMALSLALIGGGDGDRRMPRSVFRVGVAVLLFALVLNTSRAGWFMAVYVVGAALFLGAGLYLRSDKRSEIDWRKVAPVTFIVVAVCLTLGFTFMADKERRMERLAKLTRSLQNRYPLPVFSAMAAETPMSGFGPGSFPMVFPKYQVRDPSHLSTDYFLNEAHQDYFQFYFDWGAVGLGPWLMVFFIPILSAIRRRTAEHPVSEPLQFMGIVALSVVLTQAVYDFPLQVTSLLMFFGLIAACLTLPAALQNPEETVEKPAGV